MDKPIQRTTDTKAPKYARECGDSQPDSKPALTKFNVLNFGRRTALLRVTPISGRTHQIRLHTDAVGIPIVGDDVYGREKTLFDSMEELRTSALDPRKERYLYDDPLRSGLKLHAWTLALLHPMSQSPMKFVAPVPDHFVQYAESQGLSLP